MDLRQTKDLNSQFPKSLANLMAIFLRKSAECLGFSNTGCLVQGVNIRIKFHIIGFKYFLILHSIKTAEHKSKFVRRSHWDVCSAGDRKGKVQCYSKCLCYVANFVVWHPPQHDPHNHLNMIHTITSTRLTQHLYNHFNIIHKTI